MFVAGEIGFIFLYKHIKKYRERCFERNIQYVKEKYGTHDEIPIRPKLVNIIAGGLTIPPSFSFCIAIVYYEFPRDPVDALVGSGFFGIILFIIIIYCIHTCRMLVLLSDKPFITIIHYYKRKETCLPYKDIKYYKFGRSFFHVKTKKKTYDIDYNNINFDDFVKRLDQKRIPEKKSLIRKLLRY